FFFFQAEDGIRDRNVTGVQTCALPISERPGPGRRGRHGRRLGLSLDPPDVSLQRLVLPLGGRGGGGHERVSAQGGARTSLGSVRSEERRVGKEGRSGGGREEGVGERRG